ncbi:MAG: hypothetical protein PVF05_01415 [Gemmatimonadales bacterium]|jgi:hypothetical protein
MIFDLYRCERTGSYDDLRLPYAEHEADVAGCELRIALDHSFDLAALRGFRRTVAEAGDVARLELDFAGVRWLDAAALRLLTADLGDLETRGTHVVARRLPDATAERLHRHPLRRFTCTVDELFTDPDRDRTGFLPSDR